MINRAVTLPLQQSFFLFGARQTGKTTLIQARYAKRIWTVNLLLTDLFFRYSQNPSQFRLEAVEKIKKERIKTIFIDEVQRIPLLLNEVQYLMQNFSCQFILTGSSARKLKRGDSNLLAGRAVERRLFPLTYEELQERFSLEDILRFGALPVIFEKTKSEKMDILSAYVHTYLKEEIQSEGIARNIGGFSRFLDIAGSQFGEIVSFSTIARECQLPVRTVQSYYEILEDTLLGFRLPSWQKSIRKRLVAHPKFYLFDLGVTNAINKQLTAHFDPYLRGRLFEQLIVLEAYRYLQYHHRETNLYYWKTNHGAEVDLMIERHGKILGVFEIKATAHITGSHLSGLRAFREENPKVPCFVICSSQEAFEIDQVKIIPWQKFLGQTLAKDL